MASTRWRCTVCGWESDEASENPPDECPICGAGPDDFEPID